jgi:hypothetical protein
MIDSDILVMLTNQNLAKGQWDTTKTALTLSPDQMYVRKLKPMTDKEGSGSANLFDNGSEM